MSEGLAAFHSWLYLWNVQNSFGSVPARYDLASLSGQLAVAPQAGQRTDHNNDSRTITIYRTFATYRIACIRQLIISAKCLEAGVGLWDGDGVASPVCLSSYGAGS